MSDKKPWYQSKTVWGSVVAFLATVGAVFGIKLSGAEQSALAEGLAAVGGLVGFILTIYGRFKADKKLTAKR